MKKKISKIQFDSLAITLAMISEVKGSEVACHEFNRVKDKIELTEAELDYLERAIHENSKERSHGD